MRPVLSEPDQFQLTWCHWATNTRLLCGLHSSSSQGGVLHPVTRLVAMDADGKNLQVLMQNPEKFKVSFRTASSIGIRVRPIRCSSKPMRE